MLAAYEPYGPAPWLGGLPFERAVTSDDLLAYLRERLPAAAAPRVVALGSPSMRPSKALKAPRQAPAGGGTYLYYLPGTAPS